ncbi:SPFH domain-containing protein [Streptomyces sp. NPDC046759]|uniref:SPFH domain-containing protein n=1 Tax=Streptomyces sp. NPDC046759 TaxID=3155019 RepID=UPI0033D57846
MSTTTSHTPPESEGQPEGTPGPGGRPARLIQNETTAEIPVHLLFRDGPDPGNPVKVPLTPAVVARRQGTGEQPRLRGAPPVRRRPLPEVDPGLAERPARVLPGAAGLLAGACGVTGCAATSWWAGLLSPAVVETLGLPASLGAGLGPAQWAVYAGAGVLGTFGFAGLTRGRSGQAWVLGLFGRYRGTVRRTGLLWVNPLLARRRVDVRLRHWRSEAMPAADPDGVALRVVVLVVWRVRDTARAVLGVENHEAYLRGCVEAALARVPMEPAGGTGGPGAAGDGATAAGDVLTRLVAEETAPAGMEVFSVQPVRVEYAPEVAATMRRRRIAALDARQRAGMLSSVVDSVEDTVTRLTTRGLVELDDYERKVLVRDLTVAFCSGHGGLP